MTEAYLQMDEKSGKFKPIGKTFYVVVATENNIKKT